MKKIAILLPFIAGIFLCKTTFSQTTGIGEVTGIESKVATIESNKIKIAQYKGELSVLEAAWRAKINNLKDELAALYKERDNLIADMKVGARCSECRTWKTEFEKKGINFQQHLGQVKGYAVPATTEELEVTRKDFAERIAYKKVQIQNLEKGDNALIKKQNDINALEKMNEGLCREITADSKDYENIVFTDAKSEHDRWIKNLMAFAINILLADDKITIYQARAVRRQNKLPGELEKIKTRLKKENTDEQNSLSGKIAENLGQIKALQQELETFVATGRIKLDGLTQQKNKIETDLKAAALAESLRSDLVIRQKQVVEQISSTEKDIEDRKVNAQRIISSLERENKNMKDAVFQLSVNLPKQQAAEIAKAKAVYDEIISKLDQLVATSKAELANAKKAYSEKADYWKRKNDSYVNTIVSESDRMVITSRKVNCSVWNEARFKVIGNWNQVFPCVNNIANMAKPYGTNVFNFYCSGKSASTYMASYKSFLSGLSSDDQEAVRGNSNAGWFDLMTR